MDDTDATPALMATGRPVAASTSSTPPEPSPPADPVTALGERILAELGADHTNSTLTRWLAHHTAALLAAANHARDTAAPDAEARAAEARAAVLQLWEHRSAWPAGWPPARAVEMVRLLDDLPDLDAPRWRGATVLARLHDLHHQVLAALVDLATSGGENLEQGWLDTFGDRLTPDETALLSRAAAADQRLDRLLRWWDRTTEPDTDAAGSRNAAGDGDADAAEPATERPHPLAALAGVYRQIVLDLLAGARDDRSENTDDDADRETDRAAPRDPAHADAAGQGARPDSADDVTTDREAPH